MKDLPPASRIYFDLQLRLDALRQEIEKAGYRVRTTWLDEYGGSQAVTLSLTDLLTIEKTA